MRVGLDADVSVRRIGEGFGLASTVARIDVDERGIVRSYACKMCDAAAASVEIDVYRRVLARTEGVPHPEFVHGAVDDDAGVVVTRLVDGHQGDVLAGCDVSTSVAVARAIARLHARWWEHPDPTSETEVGPPPRPLTSEQIARFVRRHPDVLGPTSLDRLGSTTAQSDAHAVRSGQPRSLLHGDLHLDNVIHTDGGPVLFDWAGAGTGPVCDELARCLVEFPGSGDDDGTVFGRYVDELRRCGIEAPDGLGVAVTASLTVLLPAVARWSIGDRVTPGTRAWQLARHTLRRIDSLLGSPGPTLTGRRTR